MGIERLFSAALISIAVSVSAAKASTVFSEGTIFVEPNLITAADPTSFMHASYVGTGDVTMFDRRTGSFDVFTDAFLFDARFGNGFSMQIQVNAEFGAEDTAQVEADRWGRYIGQLPSVLMRDIDEVWIHRGDYAFGGGNRSLLIHTGRGDQYISDGILEETLVHEAVHTSLDADHANAQGWLDAQAADGMFISPYAEQFPGREDLAESFLMYLGARHLSDRMNDADVQAIEAGIPNRLDYFDAQGFALDPLVKSSVSVVPLPASGVMLLGGLAVFASLRHARKRSLA